MTSSGRDTRTAYLFLLPALLPLAVFVLYPLLNLLVVSVHRSDILKNELTFLGLANYQALFAGDDLAKAVANTVYYVAATVPLGMAVSLGLALLLNTQIRGLSLLRTLVFTPVVTSAVAAGIVFVWLLDDRGPFSTLLALFGVKAQRWLQSETWAMPAVVLMSIWKQAGYNMVLFLAGLQGIPDTYYEAAALDGAGTPWRAFRHVTWPLLWPTTFFVLVMSVIQAFRAFEPMYVMTRGGPVGSTTTLVYFIFDRAFRYGDMGQAAAASVLLALVVLGITWLQFRMQREG
jgi:ABC-type sugar transport system permease subunit